MHIQGLHNPENFLILRKMMLQCNKQPFCNHFFANGYVKKLSHPRSEPLIPWTHIAYKERKKVPAPFTGKGEATWHPKYFKQLAFTIKKYCSLN